MLAASPTRLRSRTAWRVLLAFAGSWLVALLAQIEIPLPFTPVPITGQSSACCWSELPSGRGSAAGLLPLAWRVVGNRT